MKTATIGLGVVLAFWAVLALSSTATAGTVGKVTGRVMDAKGEALPGVNVVLEGTRKGAVTDATGTYVILSVDPGVYTAKASLIGFHPVTKKEVAVRAEFTTTVDFRLQEKAVEMTEVVVTAERPPVEPDKTESRYVLTAKDIQQTPILRNVQDFVALEPGVSKDGGKFLRGSPPDETAIYVDGIRLQQTDKRVYGGLDAANYLNTHSPATTWWQGVNTNALQEISVITGGMSAEYGNAQSGVVHMVTQDGSKDFHGEFEYRFTPAGKKHWGANVYEAPQLLGNAKWSDPEWVAEVDPATGRLVHQRLNYTDWRGHYFDGYLSGSLTRSASFFVSGRSQRDAAPVPGPWKNTPRNIRTTSKLTIQGGQNVKLRFGWVYDYSELYQGGTTATWDVIDRVQKAPGRDLFIPEGSPGGKSPNTENVLYAVWTHTLSPKTFYEVRVSRYLSKEDSSDKRGNVTTAVLKTAKSGYFYLGRDQMWNTTLSRQERIGLKADLSSQVSKGHFVRAGVEFTSYDNWFTWEAMMPDGTKRIEFIGHRGVPGKGITPKEMGIYVQDKMEFEGLIVNAGIRYDRFWGVDAPLYGAFRGFLYNSLSKFQNIPYLPLKPWVNWSPRLGISYPITAKSALHFSYGHFVQTAGFRRMFQEMWTSQGGTPVPGVPYSEYVTVKWPAGTSALWPSFDKTQRKINTEVGMDWNFVSDYVVTLVTFYKSGLNQEAGQWQVVRDPLNKTRIAPSGTAAAWWEDGRGFEFSLRKEFSHHFSFRAAFNLEWTGEYYGGKGLNSIGVGVGMDSTFIMTSPLLVDWEEGNGFQRPVPWTEAKRRQALAGAVTEEWLNSNPRSIVYSEGGSSEAKRFSSRGGLTSEALEYAKGLWYKEDYTSTTTRDAYTQGRRGQGSLQVFFSSPPDLGPGPKFVGSTLLGGINANLIYRIYTGNKFQYTTLAEGKAKFSRGPLHTNVDLSVQKRLSFGRMNADLFVEVFNLFNQKDATASGADYMWYGLQGPRPDDANYLKYGDSSDRTRYIGSPRYSNVGVRFNF